MKLKKHLSDQTGFADLLNYAHLIDDGVMLNKDGAFLVSYQFKGIDSHSASGSELDALANSFNRMATLLEDGWMLHVDEVRVPSSSYAELGSFPDAVSALIDTERRQYYEAQGTHYENLQFLTFIWKFPLPVVKVTQHYFVEGLSKENDEQNLSVLLNQFNERVTRCVNLLSTQCVLERLNSADLLSYLNACISGEWLPIAVPTDKSFIDVVLARKNVVGGYVPKVGNKSIRVISILGYVNDATYPGMLDELGAYPLTYRWSNRFIALSEATAAQEIKHYQRNWHNKVKGFSGILQETFFGRPSEKMDVDALQMHQQTIDALTMNSNQSTRFGYWTSSIVCVHENENILDEASKSLTRYLEQSGFTCIQEDMNAFDAWLGTIPGHGSCQARRLFVNSLNLAHCVPLYTRWTGSISSDSASLLPPRSPPVFYAETLGKTPFRFHLDVGDVGHQVILGPTGSGKSTYLDFLIAQFLRYPNAQIFVFDKDESHKALTLALEGHYYDLGDTETLAFCPLADLSTDSQKVRACQFIEDLLFLQQVAITPDIRTAIYRAIESLAHQEQTSSRNLTVFQAAVQHDMVRKALHYYTLAGQIKLLDATTDSFQLGHLQTFEMRWLLAQKPEIYLPVLRTIFDQIEAKLESAKGQSPTLIVLEEAWLYIGHEVFAKKLKDWLKTLRKHNARVVFATQSLADLYDPATQSLTATTAAILESCPTKVYLPHPSMDAEMKTLYRKIGLSDRHIEMLTQEAQVKRDYLVVREQDSALIHLGLDAPHSLPLAFIGLSKAKSQALFDYRERYGSMWVYYWLNDQGFSDWAYVWKNACHSERSEESPDAVGDFSPQTTRLEMTATEDILC